MLTQHAFAPLVHLRCLTEPEGGLITVIRLKLIDVLNAATLCFPAAFHRHPHEGVLDCSHTRLTCYVGAPTLGPMPADDRPHGGTPR